MSRTLAAYWFCLALVAGSIGYAPQAAIAAQDAPQSAISLTNSPYTQDFDSLANAGLNSSVPAGWAFAESGANANTTYNAGTGSSTTGDTYSLGTAGSTERAFGGLLSSSLATTLGAEFRNDTGAAITSLMISYRCEQWRLGATARIDRMDFQVSTDATSLTTGAWIDMDSLDCSSTATTGSTGALDGNNSANHTTVSSTATGLNIASAAGFWLRWTDFNASGADDALSIDDFSIAPATPAAVTLADFYAEQVGDHVLVTWETVSELDNRGFNLYRGTAPSAPTTQLNQALIPSQSQGSPGGFVYTWGDRASLVPDTTYYYWVEDVDVYGVATLHGPVTVTFTAPTAVEVSQLAASHTHGRQPAWPAALIAFLALAATGLLRTRQNG